MNEAQVEKEYLNDQVSITALAKKYDTYENKIRRILIKRGIKLRDKSDAQKLALKSGRHNHPTKGRKRTAEEKHKIGSALIKKWQLMTPDEYKSRVDTAKELWKQMSPEDQEKLRSAATASIRATAKDGSKFEHFLTHYLTKAGFVVEFHREQLISNFKLQIDIFVPECSTAIEIDGPSHFLPIWGEEALQRTIKSDQEKNGLLLSTGMVILRIKNLLKSLSNTRMEIVAQQVVNVLNKVKLDFPNKENRFIELEM